MNLTVSASPHIRGKDTTARLMLDVVIALLPALAAGMLFQGPRAELVAAVCVLSALAGEWLPPQDKQQQIGRASCRERV